MRESVSGLAAREELQALSRCVRRSFCSMLYATTLSHARRAAGYISKFIPTGAVRERQLQQRREEVEARGNALTEDLLPDAVIIAVLLTLLLHHPASV